MAVDTPHGASEPAIEEAEVKRVLAEVAAEVILAVDGTKIDTRSVAVGIEWGQVTTLVTELDPADRRLDAYRKFAAIA